MLIFIDFFSSLVYDSIKGGYYMYFGKNLRYLRKLKSWSQEQVSEKLGYKSFTTIQKWESGDSEPPMNRLRSLCVLFNIQMDLILNYDLEQAAPTVLRKIKNLKHDYNYSSDSFTQMLDIAEISYNEWITGDSQTYMFYLSEIANIFDVSVNYLIGKTKLFRSFDDGESMEISIDEKKISPLELERIKKYRDLDEHGKEMVDFTLQKEWERSKALAEQNKILCLPHNFEVHAAHNDFSDDENEQQLMKEDMDEL